MTVFHGGVENKAIALPNNDPAPHLRAPPQALLRRVAAPAPAAVVPN